MAYLLFLSRYQLGSSPRFDQSAKPTGLLMFFTVGHPSWQLRVDLTGQCAPRMGLR